MPVRDVRARLAELLAADQLRQIRVAGWREPAFLHPEARLPPAIDAAALLSPFDPLIWCRPRTQRLFGLDYRFEIFVPPEKRRWGAYVLPFLLGERLVARVDLKADRTARRLLVRAAYLEPGSEPAAVATALAVELRTLAGWLGLEDIAVGNRGDFARRLGKVLKA
jgi:uncharacterized protein YcaQ